MAKLHKISLLMDMRKLLLATHINKHDQDPVRYTHLVTSKCTCPIMQVAIYPMPT